MHRILPIAFIGLLAGCSTPAYRPPEVPVPAAYSADATTRQIDRLMKAGARAYLTKPLDMPEFLKAINDATSSLAKEAPVAA